MNTKKRFYSIIFFQILFIICMADTIIASDPSKNYARLVELINLEDREGPFVAFSDFERSFDQDLLKANILYFDQHPDLVKKIKTDLGGQSIRWRLKNVSSRILYVPETRKEYTTLFESYCNEVIDDILRLTELDDPYTKIYTLGAKKPENSGTKGIYAFIVHNLAKEHLATFVFSNEEQKEIEIEITSKVIMNEVGSFSSHIYLNENGSIELIRDRHTIWQNNAENTYTALMAPVEETLHITLRQYTEKAIKDRIDNIELKTVTEVKSIVEDWISVEEAIVGGLVYTLLPSIINKHVHNFPESFVRSDIETKSGYKKYRNLKKGIKIVEQLGYKKSIKMYQDDPEIFRDLLI